LSSNNNLNSECFEVFVSALNGKSFTELYLYHCNIKDISALETCSLPNLKLLVLSGNNISKEGCITLSHLLHKEDTSLTTLYLDDTGINDEGAEVIAASIKHNTVLKGLNLKDNNISEEGCVAFLKLVADVSSIESTYNSNHTLTDCSFIRHAGNPNEIQSLINSACKINLNKQYESSHSAGRAKVIENQLNSQNRKKLCRLQGIEYTSGSIFADVDPILLPKILALIRERHGHSELYTALIPAAPDLLSYNDRKALIDDELAKNMTQVTELAEQISLLSQRMSALSAKNVQLSKRREMIEQEISGKQRSMTDGDKKRKIQH